MKPTITILTITFALMSIVLSMVSITINVKASRRLKRRLAELSKRFVLESHREDTE